MLRGTSDPDIIVKRPAESRGGMTVTIFKVGTMDWSRIINSFIISRINASLSTLCDYQYMIANVCLACSVRVYICNFSLFRLFSCHDWIIMLWSSKVCEACSEEFCHGACVLFDYSHQVSFDYSHQVDFDHNQVNLINVFLKVCFQTN